jgi:hypothetical protein
MITPAASAQHPIRTIGGRAERVLMRQNGQAGSSCRHFELAGGYSEASRATAGLEPQLPKYDEGNSSLRGRHGANVAK